MSKHTWEMTVADACTPAIGQETVEQIRQGDEHAFARLVSEYMPAVYRYLFRMLGSQEDAEDLTQDTFYELHKGRERLQLTADIAPYLFTIARRKAISRFRWRTVRRVLTPLNEVHENTLPGSDDGPRQHLDQDRQEKAVLHALQGLKEEKRTVIVLRFFEELTYTEIAAVLGKPEGTVKSLAFRAERELRQRLDSLPDLAECEVS